MHSQVRDLLKSARLIGHPDMILVHSTDSVTTVSMLGELHTVTCLRCLQVDLCDTSVKMSYCPSCMYTSMNDLSYLNHIIIAHYNDSYGCGKCLKQVFMLSSALHNHRRCASGSIRNPWQVLTASPAVAVEVTAAKAVASQG